MADDTDDVLDTDDELDDDELDADDELDTDDPDGCLLPTRKHDFSGEVLGARYLLRRRLAIGTTSTIYEAKDRRMGTTVALKVLHPELNSDTYFVRRFAQEARLAAQVRHPNLVPAHDCSWVGGRHFIVFELVRGGTLQELLDNDPLPWPRATALICDLLAGLAALHELGVAHRDISPGNCLVDTAHGERGRLIDLGYARLLDRRGLDVAKQPRSRRNLIFGTEGFIEPERLNGGPADYRADVFSLGAVWYAMLTGRTPLDPCSIEGAFTPIFTPLPMPEPLVAVLRGALAPRAERYPSAGAMAAAIHEARRQVDAQQLERPQLDGPQLERPQVDRDGARRLGPWAMAASLIFGAAVAGLATWASLVTRPEPALAAVLDAPPPMRAPEDVATEPTLVRMQVDVPQAEPAPARDQADARPAELDEQEKPSPAREQDARPAEPARRTILTRSNRPKPSGLRSALAACKPAGAHLDIAVVPGEAITINDGPPLGELGRCVESALDKHPPKQAQRFRL